MMPCDNVSRISGSNLKVKIEASDRNGESFSIIRLMKNGAQEKQWTPNGVDPAVEMQLKGAAGDYFYVIVQQQDKDRAISSPIFITQ